MTALPTPDAVQTVSAGHFGEWLAQFRAALRGDSGIDVPCGECVGCCVSGYSIQVRATDRRALANIPVTLLLEAPGYPGEDRVMPPRADGTCQMLSARRCTIYADRPQTCLDYDCRIFAAAGIEAGFGKDVINARVRAWRFTYPAESDRRAHEAVRAAASFIEHKRSRFSGARVPRTPTGIAVMAVKVYEVFLESATSARPEEEVAGAVLHASREFDLDNNA
jgi:Fe-S-cluster containining protein